MPWSTYNHEHNLFGGHGADEALLSDAAAAARVEVKRGEAGAGVGAEAGRGEEGALVRAGACAGAAGGGGGKHRDPFHVRVLTCVCMYAHSSRAFVFSVYVWVETGRSRAVTLST